MKPIAIALILLILLSSTASAGPLENFQGWIEKIKLTLASITGSYGGAYEITSADCTTPGYNDPAKSERIYYNVWYNDGGWRVTKYDAYTYGCPDSKSKSSWFTNDRNLAIKWGLAYGANPSVAEFFYTLNLIKSGSGSIEKIDANNNWIPSETSFTDLANTAFRFRAVPSLGYNFKKWCTGDCSGVYSSYSEISWQLTNSETLTAVFELAPTPTPTASPTSTLPPVPTATPPASTPSPSPTVTQAPIPTASPTIAPTIIVSTPTPTPTQTPTSSTFENYRGYNIDLKSGIYYVNGRQFDTTIQAHTYIDDTISQNTPVASQPVQTVIVIKYVDKPIVEKPPTTPGFDVIGLIFVIIAIMLWRKKT